MNTINLSNAELERLRSIVASHNVRMKLSGDWPEQNIDKAIHSKVVDALFIKMKREKEIS